MVESLGQGGGRRSLLTDGAWNGEWFPGKKTGREYKGEIILTDTAHGIEKVDHTKPAARLFISEASLKKGDVVLFRRTAGVMEYVPRTSAMAQRLQTAPPRLLRFSSFVRSAWGSQRRQGCLPHGSPASQINQGAHLFGRTTGSHSLPVQNRRAASSAPPAWDDQRPRQPLPRINMVHRTRQDYNDDEVHGHPSPVTPSFESLPDIAHDSIASFHGNRIDVSEASRALFKSYGGSLIEVHLNHNNGNAARLAALLRRQNKLEGITVYKQEAIPALALAIVDGCCRGIARLNLRLDANTAVTQERLDLLAAALEMEGTLLALSELKVKCDLEVGGLSRLTKALACGNAPLLQHFYVKWADFWEHELVSIAEMVEARARISGCKKLETFRRASNVDDDWFMSAAIETQIRLLRALLPSVKELPLFEWNQAHESCFLDAQATYLTTFHINLEEWADVFSCGVLEAAPALVEIKIGSEGSIKLGGTALQAVSEALRHGALQKLKDFELCACTLGGREFSVFMKVLEESGCAKRLLRLSFSNCDIRTEGVRTLADLLNRDTFPALKKLHFIDHPSITNEGVMALAEALLRTTQTQLTELCLCGVSYGRCRSCHCDFPRISRPHAGLRSASYIRQCGRDRPRYHELGTSNQCIRATQIRNFLL